MKKKILLFLFVPLALSCGRLSSKGEGELRISFSSLFYDVTRSVEEIPDTSDFILEITDSEGNFIYDGLYGDSPESVTVASGSYVVRAVSCRFDKPAFSAPQFGDEQCVVLTDESVVNVRLECSQLNAGVRLRIDPGFHEAFPESVLLLKSADGSLMYSVNEKRTAYFNPGNVSLVLSHGAEDEVLMTRRLEAQEILSLGIKASTSGNEPSHSSGIEIAVDTSRYWINEEFVVGGDNGRGESDEQPLTVSQARASVGEEDVWVSGYIVGGDLTSASASFSEPFTSRTNILLGSRSKTDDREVCVSVQLASGDIRDNLNLVDNPQLLGRKVCVKGDIVEAYYGLTGIKNVNEFKIL